MPAERNKDLPPDRRVKDGVTDEALRALRELLRDVLRRLDDHDSRITDLE